MKTRNLLLLGSAFAITLLLQTGCTPDTIEPTDTSSSDSIWTDSDSTDFWEDTTIIIIDEPVDSSGYEDDYSDDDTTIIIIDEPVDTTGYDDLDSLGF